MKMSKRIMSAVLAAAMTLAISAPAFAAGSTGTATSSNTDVVATATNATPQTHQTVVDSTYRAPQLKVTLPSGVTVVSNPYKLQLSAHSNDTSQIYCPTLEVKNTGECAVAINVKATATVSDTGLKLLSKPATKASETKDVFLFVEFSANHAAGSPATLTGSYSEDSALQLVPSAKGASLEEAIKLPNTGDNAFSFKVNGQLNGEATEQWSEADLINATIAFEIIPTTITTP